MTQVQIIPGNFTITDPDTPTYFVRQIATSDDLAGTGIFARTATNAALGGVSYPMTTLADGWVHGTTGIKPNANANYGATWVEGLKAGADAEITVVERPTGSHFFSFFMAPGKENLERCILRLRGDGTIALLEEASGIPLATITTYSAGDRVRFRVSEGELVVWVNGTERARVALAVPAASYGWLGLSYFSGTMTSGEVARLVITEPAN